MSDWKYFTEDELKCSHSGKCLMDPGFMSTLEAIRIKCDFPFTITSAYRDPTHQQKGGGRFIHLDNLSTEDGFARPNIWSY